MERVDYMTDSALDVVGVGFGIANLALAVVLEECVVRTTSALFLERQRDFGWHRGMLIEGSMMQISFLKDIVTMRGPTSDYSFLTYLHEKNNGLPASRSGIPAARLGRVHPP